MADTTTTVGSTTTAGSFEGEKGRDKEIKPKRSRASKPKVKTGCQTCKIRRVKCDETKPYCLRCVRFGHQCDGYASSTKQSISRSTSSGSSHPRPLIPKETKVEERGEQHGDGETERQGEGGKS